MKISYGLFIAVFILGCHSPNAPSPATDSPGQKPGVVNSFTFVDPQTHQPVTAKVVGLFVNLPLTSVAVTLKASILSANLGFITSPNSTLKRACLAQKDMVEDPWVMKREAGIFSMEAENWSPATEKAALEGAVRAGFANVVHVTSMAQLLLREHKLSVSLGPLTKQAAFSAEEADLRVTEMVGRGGAVSLPIGLFCDLLNGDAIVTARQSDGRALELQLLSEF